MITIAARHRGRNYRKIYDCNNGFAFTLEELLQFQAKHDMAKDCQLEAAREVQECQPGAEVKSDYLNEAKRALYDPGFTQGQMRLLNLYKKRGLPEDTAVLLAYWSVKDWDAFQELRAAVS